MEHINKKRENSKTGYKNGRDNIMTNNKLFGDMTFQELDAFEKNNVPSVLLVEGMECKIICFQRSVMWEKEDNGDVGDVYHALCITVEEEERQIEILLQPIQIRTLKDFLTINFIGL